MKKTLKLLKFKNEEQERKFWSDFDLSKHFKDADFKSVSFPNLKPTSRSISLRIPEYLFIRVKQEANELNIPYQTLLKQYIAKGVFKTKSF